MAKGIECEVEWLLRLIGGRWKLVLLRELFQGARRPAELRRALSGISQKVLTQRLRELERAGVIVRHDFKTSRPRVEYSLTPFGRRLRAVILALHRWAVSHRQPPSGV
jgi:DNA-binding HxlR family transcriptional regulator